MLKKILGILTVISALAWLGFFLNGMDQNQFNIIFLFAATANLILVVKTKFWKESTEKEEGITIIRFLFVGINVFLIFTLLPMMRTEIDLDDSDDVYILILILFSVIVPFLYLLKTTTSFKP
jgi:hypothetical protein